MSGRKGMVHSARYDGRLRFSSSMRKSILRATTRFAEVGNAEIRAYLGLGEDKSNHVSCELRALRRAGWLERVSGGPGSTNTRHRITPAGLAALNGGVPPTRCTVNAGDTGSSFGAWADSWADEIGTFAFQGPEIHDTTEEPSERIDLIRQRHQSRRAA